MIGLTILGPSHMSICPPRSIRLNRLEPTQTSATLCFCFREEVSFWEITCNGLKVILISNLQWELPLGMNDGYINGFLHFLCEWNDDGSGHSSEYKVWGEAAWNSCQMGLSTIHIAHILPACKIKIKAPASCLGKGLTNFALPCFGSAEYLCVCVICMCPLVVCIAESG